MRMHAHVYNEGQPTACDSDGVCDILFENQTPHQSGEIGLFYFWILLKKNSTTIYKGNI